MSKQIIIGVVIVAVLVGGYFVMTSQQTGSQTVPTTTNVTSPTETMPVATSSTEIMSKEFSVVGTNYKFNPNTINVKKGERVKITFKSEGGQHDFVLDEFKVKTSILENGQTESIEFVADKIGTFEYYCGVGNHRQMGMKGTLIVE